jgi:hypothetical protein
LPSPSECATVVSSYSPKASFRARCFLRHHLAALCDRRPGGRDGVSGVDGLRRLSDDGDALDGAGTQHRGSHVLDVDLQPRKGRRLEKSAATSVFVATDVVRRRVYRAERASLQVHDGHRVLLLAGAATILRRHGAAAPDREAPLWGIVGVGAVVGLVSGLTGVGGGVFLAPTLIALRWASPKQTAALSAPFILANSAVGLVGVLFSGQPPSPHLGIYAAAALGGAIVGTAIGLRWLGQAGMRFILAGILLAAGIQLLFF